MGVPRNLIPPLWKTLSGWLRCNNSLGGKQGDLRPCLGHLEEGWNGGTEKGVQSEVSWAVRTQWRLYLTQLLQQLARR